MSELDEIRNKCLKILDEGYKRHRRFLALMDKYPNDSFSRLELRMELEERGYISN